MKISQADNYSGNFGDVLRSSALFWYKKSSGFRTTCSVLNYWPIKRNVRVTVLYTLRTLAGVMVERRRVDFSSAQVAHLRPGPEEFEGSIEVEVFSIENLVIPYAAVMVVYESGNAVTAVHSYGRTYSNHEIEEGRTICEGEESCWTLCDTDRTRSFGVFHNGARPCAPQSVRLGVQRQDNEKIQAEIALPALRPYETIKLYPTDHLPELTEFLGGKPGNATLSFRTEGSFTRLLVGNEGEGDIQVTHSNFNYARHQTDLVNAQHQQGYMPIPRIAGHKCEVVVYPDRNPGTYHVEGAGISRNFHDTEMVTLPLTAMDGPQMLRFSRKDGLLPSRIVTGLRIHNGSTLAAECSLGIIHHIRPPKRFWWGLCHHDTTSCRLLACDLPEVYGGVGAASLELNLYSATSSTPLQRKLTSAEGLLAGMSVEEIFPGAREFLGGDLGWWTLGSAYGGLFLYSQMQGPQGSTSLEHGF